MTNKKFISKWQHDIVHQCEKLLDRNLSEDEELFITRRNSFLALEAIEDSVGSLSIDKLCEYLNSETGAEKDTDNLTAAD